MIPVHLLPWFQFAAFVDATGGIKYADSLAPYFLNRTLCQSEQSATSNKLDIGSPDTTATRHPNQGLVLGAANQSSLNESQDSRFNMIAAIPYATDERTTNNLRLVILKLLSVLPENTHKNLGPTAQSSVMQIIKLWMFLSSNNHTTAPIKDSIDVEKTVLRMVRAHNGLQYKHLLSHIGPTSEALSEKIFESALGVQDIEVIRIALDCGIDPNKQVFISAGTLMSPLQLASSQGNVEIASILLNAGAEVNGSILENAVWSENPEMVNLLLAKGAHASTTDGDEALRFTVQVGDIVSARSLISAGADVASADDKGYTALHLACAYCFSKDLAYGSSEMVKVLLQAGADVNAVSDSGITALECAVHNGSIDTIQSLLDAGAKVFGSAIYVAARHGDVETLKILLSAGADVNGCFEKSRRTALTRAVENENASFVRFLLESGADVNGCTLEHDSLDYSDPYECWSRKYSNEIGSGNWNEWHWKNYTPLQAASFHQDTGIARILIEAGANVNMDFATGTLFKPEDFKEIFDEDREADGGDEVFYGTAFQIAAHQGNMELIRLFWTAGANVNAPAYQEGGRTALQAAIENGDHMVIDFLLAAGADVNAAAAEKYGTSALAAAIMRQDPNLSSSIIKAGAKITSARHSGVTALAAATATRDVATVRILLLPGTIPVDSAALQAAVANDDIELLRILLAARANSNDHGERYYGYNALYKAALNERHELARILLASQIDPNIHPSDAPWIMSYLPNTRKWIYTNRHASPWYLAIKSGNLRLVRIFLEAGANPNLIFRWETYQEHCLWSAIEQEHVPLTQMLLEAGADVNFELDETNTCGERAERGGTNTVLGYAAWKGQTDNVRLLLKAGARPNTPANGRFGRTALQAAAVCGHEDAVDILIEAGADVNAPPSSYGGVTALQATAIGGFLRMTRVLIEAGADVNAAAAEEEGRTALTGAAEHGRIDMLQYLLDNGADIDGPGRAQYDSAIHLAARNGHLSACNLLKSHHRRLYGSS